MQSNPFGAFREIKYKTYSGTTDSTENLVFSDLPASKYFVLGVAGTGEGTGTLKYLVGGVPMVTNGGYWFAHTIRYDGNSMASVSVSLTVAYVEL